MKIHALLAVLVMSAGGAAFAQTVTKDPMATPRVDARQERQEKRIEYGEKSGQLTSHEANRLEKGEAHIEKAEDRAKADGVVTGKERAHLTHMQNRESKAIYRQKHDRQTDLNHNGKKDRMHAKK